MVARLCRGAVADNAEGHLTFLTKTWMQDCMKTARNRGVAVLRRGQGRWAEFLLVSLWDSMNSPAGSEDVDIERATYHPEDGDLPETFKLTLEHFEVLSFRANRVDIPAAYGLEQFLLSPLG